MFTLKSLEYNRSEPDQKQSKHLNTGYHFARGHHKRTYPNTHFLHLYSSQTRPYPPMDCTTSSSGYILRSVMKPSTSVYNFAQLIFLLMVAPMFLSAGTLHELSDQREELTQQLDSLNLLKQDLKREGTAITEIELRQARLRDSLNYLRTRIQLTSAERSPLGTRKSPGLFQIPATMFDWTIVIVGGVAFFSGLMLVIGITRSFSSRKKRRSTKKKNLPPVQPHIEKTETYKPVPAFPSAEPPPTVSNDKSDPSSLPQRIARSPAPPIDSGPFPHNDRLQPQKKSSTTTKEDPSSLEQQILDAANSGLDAGTISRKFHISVDHVALLLKMSMQERK